MKIDLRLGDCIEVLKTIPDNSIDSIVTDPPYGIGFMNKEWDNPQKHQELIEREKKRSEERYAEGKSPAKAGFSTGVQPGLPIGGAKEGKWFQDWCELWARECYRVLKPGGHALSFSAPRTYHRMATAFEDSGFQIRDQIMWVFGSGFPKSLNIGKAIDKRGGNNHLTQEVADKLKEARQSRNITKTQADEMFCNGTTNYMWFEGRSDGIRLPDDESFKKICNEWEELKPYQDLIKSANREVVGQYDGDMGGLGGERLGQLNGDITIAATEAAKNWEGWGTALKPAHEPIVMARKPLSEKSIAENVLKHGTGGINIDGSRIDVSEKEKVKTEGHIRKGNVTGDERTSVAAGQFGDGAFVAGTDLTNGRWPANIIFDEEAGKLLDEQSGYGKGQKNPKVQKGTRRYGENQFTSGGMLVKDGWVSSTYNDEGGASRFFYCPKASKKDKNEGLDNFEEKALRISSGGTRDFNARCANCGKKFIGPPEKICDCDEPVTDNQVFKNKNNHPTVKPTDLMRYLINLVTPKGGTTLDPFMGSGSTGKAAVQCGVNFIGIEKEEEYMKIAEARINHETNKTTQGKLF